jgi:uncharacterized protein YcbX
MSVLRAIYRHPVKGLRPELLSSGRLLPGRGLEGDRAFAFQFLDESVPAELRAAPAETAPWMFKSYLAVQHDWPDLARIEPSWDAATSRLTLRAYGLRGGLAAEVSGCLARPTERQTLATFVRDFLRGCQPYERAKHPDPTELRLVGAADLGGRYTDSGGAPVSLVLRESLRDLEQRYRFAVDERRFRINLCLEGAPAWAELGWMGRRLRVGGCVLQIAKPIGRCPNIDVHPESGERRDEIFPSMKSVLGHALTGMRAEVLEAGDVRPGDAWELLA